MSLLANSNAIETGGYQISRSVRLRSSASAYFNRTIASTSNRRTFTVSGWVKKAKNGQAGFQTLTSWTNVGGTKDEFFVVQFSNSLDVASIFSRTGGVDYYLSTAAVLRDNSAWYHLVYTVDTTQATASDRFKIYINGQQAAIGSSAYPPQNYDLPYVNVSGKGGYIGAYYDNPWYYFDGYLTEINFIDGQALTPSSFGETDANTGVWVAKKYVGSYGTNGFFLTFADNSAATSTTIGKDYSGNGNNWTPNNISVTAGTTYDSMLDVPSGNGYADGGNGRGNYATLNPLDTATSSTLTNGNLTNTLSTGSGSSQASTVAMTSGKWYWEVSESSVTNQSCGVGILRANLPATVTRDSNPGGVYYVSGGSKFIDGTNTSYGTAWGSTGVTYVIGVALDLDAGTVTFYLNNTSQGAITLPSNTYGWRSHAIWSSASGTGTFETNFGQRPFSYTPPTGFKALNTTNLSDPTVKKGSSYFNAALYTGNGNSSRSFTGFGFQPDFIWSKARSGGASDHALADVVRGVGGSKLLYTNLTSAEGTYPSFGAISSFDADGYSINSSGAFYNSNTVTYVDWFWKANGTGVSNTAGSITSTVSANTTSGFSIVTWTGTGANATVGHGLGVAPSMIINKPRNAADNWISWHTSLGNLGYVYLNNTTAAGSGAVVWNSTLPTSSVFSVGTSSNVNTSGQTMVSYCFAAVPGYSAFGSYTGNGSADGPFVYCGFRPKYVLIKQSSTSGTDWIVYDSTRNPYNLTNLLLSPNSSAAEATSAGSNTLDLLSNGFKLRSTSTGSNGGTMIYAAFAENPFKYSNAR